MREAEGFESLTAYVSVPRQGDERGEGHAQHVVAERGGQRRHAEKRTDLRTADEGEAMSITFGGESIPPLNSIRTPVPTSSIRNAGHESWRRRSDRILSGPVYNAYDSTGRLGEMRRENCRAWPPRGGRAVEKNRIERTVKIKAPLKNPFQKSGPQISSEAFV